MVFLALRGNLALSPLAEQIAWSGAVGLVIVAASRPVLDFRVRRLGGTLAVGVTVFLLWIAPDLLAPGYRGHWLFSNAVTGQVASSMPEAVRQDAAILALRAFRAAIIVPIAEELFWRGWLMRWLIKPDFAAVPLGAYTPLSFWVVAILFASEHGPHWDVGLAAGIVYNWWMVRSRSLGDLILAHGVTNACLSVYVVTAGEWEYW
jgi:CAAX prenyl protease-like protein